VLAAIAPDVKDAGGMKAVIATSTAFHLRHLAAALIERGWEVEFHSYLPRWKTRAYGLPDSSVVSHFLALLPWSALALLRGGGRWLRPLREGLFARVDRRIARTMSGADVFIGLSAVTVASAEQARKAGALVLIERGSSHILTQQATARATGAAAPTALYVERELASYALADRIVVLSRFSARTFADQGEAPERLEVMPLGVDLARFTPPATPPPGPLRALVVGNWSSRKGCDLVAPLLEALPGLCVSHVGLADGLPFPDHPRFRTLGYLDHDRLPGVMRDHHLLLFPSRDDGFGMVMAEALGCGLRVIASDASGGPDLAAMVGAPAVTIVRAGSLEDLTAAVSEQVQELAGDPSGFSPAPARVAALSWNGYADRYQAMLNRLLEHRPQ
jgi:glycosyltransferase involved in cell wall biosynthesis